jgi:hypothetical protein
MKDRRLVQRFWDGITPVQLLPLAGAAGLSRGLPTPPANRRAAKVSLRHRLLMTYVNLCPPYLAAGIRVSYPEGSTPARHRGEAPTGRALAQKLRLTPLRRGL